MDGLNVRNYVVVAVAGVLCLLLTSVVSAQTATNLNCTGCVNKGEVANNTVSWFNLDGVARGFLTNQANDVADVKSNQSPVVLDGNDVEIGQLVSIGENHISIEVITQQGYLLTLAPNPGIGPANSVFSLFFTSSDCTGTAYTGLTFGGYVISGYDLTGVPSLYYVDKNSAGVSNLSYASLTTSGGCSVQAGVSSTFFPVLPNDSTVTGVSTVTPQLPIKIQRP